MTKKSKPAGKSAKRAATHAKRAAQPAPRAARTARASKPVRRLSWLNASGSVPQIDAYARNMKSFIDAMADGKVDPHEVEAQERRLVAIMKKLEPKLDDATHAAVTELLCEMAVYDLMQVLQSMNAARQAHSTFRG